MNGTTKNDLSGNRVKLDYAAMVTSAEIAYVMLRNELLKELNETYNLKTGAAAIFMNAARIKDLAKDFALVADTYIALKEGVTREEKELILN